MINSKSLPLKVPMFGIESEKNPSRSDFELHQNEIFSKNV